MSETDIAENLRNSKEKTKADGGVVDFILPKDKKVSAYLMAPCRGKAGEAVDDATKLANVQLAVEVGEAIRKAFPDLDLYVPHEHEEVVHLLWRNGLAGADIVKATSQIAVSKDFSIAYTEHELSEGMAAEMAEVAEAGKDTVVVAHYDKKTKQISGLGYLGIQTAIKTIKGDWNH